MFKTPKSLSIVSFLSGCLPISTVSMINNYDSCNRIIFWFSVVFLLVTIVSSYLFYNDLRKREELLNDNKVVIKNVNRKNLFSTGAMSYYVLPFISFVVASSWKNIATMLILLIVFGCIFVNNRMFAYSPLLDFLGYKVFECDLYMTSQGVESKIGRVSILLTDSSNVYLSSANTVSTIKIDDDIYLAKIITAGE